MVDIFRFHFRFQYKRTKKNMDLSKMLKVKKLTKEEAEKWLHEIGLAVSGTKEELISWIIKYKRYPKLVKKQKSRICHVSRPAVIGFFIIPVMTFMGLVLVQLDQTVFLLK